MSPLLFDLAADALAIVMEKAKPNGLIPGLLGEYIEKGVNMLQYADDTIFLLPDDMESAKNLKFILCAFEQMSGLKINFHKSELFLFGEAADKSEQYKRIFTCSNGSLPMRYLGIPVNKMRIRNKDWSKVQSKVASKCVCWQGRLLNITGRTTLVQTCLTIMNNVVL